MLASKYAEASPSEAAHGSRSSRISTDLNPSSTLPHTRKRTASGRAQQHASSLSVTAPEPSPVFPMQSSAVTTKEMTEVKLKLELEPAVPMSAEPSPGNNQAPEDEKPINDLPSTALKKMSKQQTEPTKQDSLLSPSSSTPDILQRAISPGPNAKKVFSRKGKPCIIRIPPKTAHSRLGWLPISDEEYCARIETFEHDGYDTRGFDHWRYPADAATEAAESSQNRAIFPPPPQGDFEEVGQDTTIKVAIPNFAQWDAYVNHLTEEKLKALGVTMPSADGPEVLQQISFGTSAASPPLPTSSVASQHLWQQGLPFSAPFSPAANTSNTSFAPIASPALSFAGQARPGHLSRQSTYGSPFPQSPQGSILQQQGWPTAQSLLNQGLPRIGTPANHSPFNHLQSISRASPDIIQAGQRTPRGNLDSVQTSLDGSRKVETASISMADDKNDRNTTDNAKPLVDIANPTPRGHHHNISETLEREAESAQYYPGEYVDEHLLEASEGPINPSRASGADDTKKSSERSTQRSSGHQAMPSITSSASGTTRLNVKAKEFKFDPDKASGKGFSMSKNSLLPAPATQPAVSFITAHANGGTTGGSTFNVAAPSFQPPAQGFFPFFSSGFNFSAKAPTTAADAAAAVDKTETDSVDATKDKESVREPTPRIFSKINLSEIVKPSKESKAIRIVDPKSDYHNDSEEMEHEDEAGRLAQDAARFKRGRREAPGGDDIPRFEIPISEKSGDHAIVQAKDDSTTQASLHKSVTKSDEDDSREPWHDFGFGIPKLPSVDLAIEMSSPVAEQSRTRVIPQSPRAPDHGGSASEDKVKNLPLHEALAEVARSPSLQELNDIMDHLNKEDSQGHISSDNEKQSISSQEDLDPLKSSGFPNLTLPSKLPTNRTAERQISPPRVSTQWLQEQQVVRKSESPVRNMNSLQDLPISDWDDVLSNGEEAKSLPQAQFFDTRVKSLIESVLRQYLDPLQKSMQEMSVSAKKTLAKDLLERRMASSHEQSSSDADDEDNADLSETTRPKTKYSDRKLGRITTAVQEAIITSRVASTAQFEAEVKLRHDAEQKYRNLQVELETTEKQTILLKDASSQKDAKVSSLEDERDDLRLQTSCFQRTESELRARISDLLSKVTALEETVDEYRASSTKWRHEIDSVKTARESLSGTIARLRKEAVEGEEDREALRNEVERLQEGLRLTSKNLTIERSSGQRREEETSKDLVVFRARLEEEVRTRLRMEKDLNRLSMCERDAIKASVTLEETRNANARLNVDLAKLREQYTNQQNDSALHEREAIEAKDIARSEIQRTKTVLGAEMQVTIRRADNDRMELETRLQLTRNELDSSRARLETVRAETKKATDEANAARTLAVREASDSANARLAEERQRFERSLNDLSAQHDRVLRNAFDDKERSETHVGESLRLANEKVVHMEDRVKHLEDKVTIAQSAAQAAAQAARQSKTSTNSISMPPDRVSPQALRESIVVLQEQLQQRESTIESLEQDLASVDRDAPIKVRERETEIGWLRELLGVRLDDLAELVKTLSLGTYDRVAARDAAIRIKANLQMEQQEKERLLSGTPRPPTLPSLSDLQSFASPKAAQIAAAWGSWRKTGQTPSKATAAASTSASVAQTFLSGLMTPPASNLRRSPSSANSGDIENPATLSLPSDNNNQDIGDSPAKSRAQARTRLVSRSQFDNSNEPPKTPPLMRKTSYDVDAELAAVDDSAMYDDDLEEGESSLADETTDQVHHQPFLDVMQKSS